MGFLLANIKPDIIFEKLFLTMSNADVDFLARDLKWSSYITGNIFSTTKKVELIKKKKFAAAVLDPEYKIFGVYVVALSVDSIDEVYSSRRALIAHFKANKVLTKVLSKYANFADVFLSKFAADLSKYTEINDHAIALVND